MTRPVIDADTIATLRNRVVAHNEAGAGRRVNLGELKKVYLAGWRGDDPADRALRKVDRHLADLAKSEFDETKHRRDDSGRFTAKLGQARQFQDTATPQQHRELKQENEGYRASQTDIIPETRWSTFGPWAFGLAGIARGAMQGAVPDSAKTDPVWLAGKYTTVKTAGGFARLAAGAATGAGLAMRGFANRLSGRPPSNLAENRATIGRVGVKAQQMAEKGASAVWRGVDWLIDENPVTGLRRFHRNRKAAIDARGLRGPERILPNIARFGGGAALGALVPGAAMGYGGYKVMEAAGPYIDSYVGGRRIEKSATATRLAKVRAVPDAALALRKAGFRPFRPQVLAKVAAHPAASAELEKSFIGPALRGAKAMGARALSALRVARPTSAASTPAGATARQAGITAQGQARARRMMRENAFSRPGKLAIAGVGIAGGAGIGAGAAAAAEWAQRRYYRDEKGRFTSKDQDVGPGWAAVGAAAGAVAGAIGAGALIAGNRRAAIQAAVRQAYGMRTADAADAAEKARQRVMASSKKEIDAAKTTAATMVSDLKRAAGDPLEWNRWQVDKNTAEKITRRLRSDDFWGSDKRLRPAATKAFRSNNSVDSLRNLGLSQSQLDELDGIATAAAKQKTDFEARVTAFRAKAQEALNASSLAEAAVEQTRQAKSAAEKTLKGLTDEAEIGAKTLEIRNLEETLKRQLDQAKKLKATVDDYVEAETRARGIAGTGRPSVSFPEAPDPWLGSKFVLPMPSDAKIAALTTELEEKAIKPIMDRANRAAQNAAGEAQAVALATVTALNRSRHPGVVGAKISDVAATMGRHMASAKRDVAAAGGTVKGALKRRFGLDTPPRPGEMRGELATAFTTAKDKLKGAARDAVIGMVQNPLKTVAGLAATSAPAAVLLGAADYNQDGELNFSLKNANLQHALDPKTAPRPVVRVYHAGTKDQVTVTGIVGSNKKGERVFVSGEIRDADGKVVTTIPALALLKDITDQVKQRRSNQGGGSGGAQIANLPGDLRKDIDEAISKARQGGGFDKIGEGDLEVEFRKPGFNDGGVQSAASRLMNHLREEVKKINKGDFARGVTGDGFYQMLGWASSPNASIATAAERSGFLQNQVFVEQLGAGIRQGNSGDDTAEAFIKHLTAREGGRFAVPHVNNDNQERALKRAVRVINQGLSGSNRVMNDAQLARVDLAISRHRRGGSGTGGASPGGGSGSGGAGSRGGAGAASSSAPRTRDDYRNEAIDAVLGIYKEAGKRPSPKVEEMVERHFSTRETKAEDRNGPLGNLSDEERWGAIRDEVVAVHRRIILNRSHGATTLRKNDQRSWFEPVRMGGTVGGAVGAQALYEAASRFMPRRIRNAGKVARLGWTMGASLVGGAAGAAGGEALGRKPYEGMGLRPPPSWDPRGRSWQEETGRAGGSIGGQLLGSALGARRGFASAFTYGLAGQLGGEEAGGWAGRAAERRMTPPKPPRRP